MTSIATQHDLQRLAYSRDESEIDEALVESFPASDAPSWTLGVSPSPVRRDVIDVSSPPIPAGAWAALLSWIEAAALAVAFALGIAAAGAVVGLVVRLLVDVVAWLR